MVNYLNISIILFVLILKAPLTTSVCKYLFFFFILVCSFKDYVDQIYSNNVNGSQSYPYSNISNAILQNQDKFFNLTLILVANSQPYNLTQKELLFSFNITLMYMFSHFLLFFLNNDIF